jgi:hypothetical protein
MRKVNVSENTINRFGDLDMRGLLTASNQFWAFGSDLQSLTNLRRLRRFDGDFADFWTADGFGSRSFAPTDRDNDFAVRTVSTASGLFCAVHLHIP